MHGTNESQQLVQSILCELVARDVPIRFGVEAERDQSDSLNNLTKSDFTPQKAYAAAPKMWDSHDGRSSEAALRSLVQVSAWRTAGADLEVFAFDFAPSEYPIDLERSRHATMAAMVDQAAKDFEGAVILIAGGYHTPVTRLTMEPQSGSMADMLTVRPVVSLSMAHDGGEAFVTYSKNGSKVTTGILEVLENHQREYSSWTVNLSSHGVHYRGVYSTGFITASPPAFPTEH
ncbi:MAG: hypothetical protein AAFN91_18145 [Pseudomonadota bacterium]